MAWASVAGRGAATIKTAGNTLTMNPSGAVPVGAILAVAVAWESTAGGAGGDNIGHLTCADSVGNTYECLFNVQQHVSSVNGVMVALFISKLTTALTTLTPITVTCVASSVPIAKAMTTREFSVAANKTYSVKRVQTTTEAAATTLSVTTSNILDPAENRLWLGVGAAETTVATGTLDADYTHDTDQKTTGGGDSSNVRVRFGRRFSTLNQDTFSHATGATSCNHAVGLVALEEVDYTPPPPTGGRPVIDGERRVGVII